MSSSNLITQFQPNLTLLPVEFVNVSPRNETILTLNSPKSV